MRKPLVCIQLLLITTGLVASLPSVARASTTSIEVVPSPLEKLPGDSFIVNITVNDVTDLYLWMFRLRWNSTVLQLNSIEEGPFLQSGGDTSDVWLSPTISEINGAGRIEEATCSLLEPVPGVDGSGTIATLNFTCLSIGNTALEFWEEAPDYEPATDLLNSDGNTISHTPIPVIVHVIPEFTSLVLIAVFLLATLFAMALGKKAYSVRRKGP